MQIQTLSPLAPAALSPLPLRPSRLPAHIQPTNSLSPQDTLRLHSLRGTIPTELGLFGSSAPQLATALKKLHSHASEANFKETQAQYRVSLRSLSISELECVVHQLEAEMKHSADYRTQIFLDQALVDTRMEIFYKGGKPGFPEPGMPPIPGQEPRSIVENTLKLLHSNPTEANYRTAQAGFRMAIRALSMEQLETSVDLIRQHMSQLSDYRSQKLLHGLKLDLALEIVRKGGKPDFEEPGMPPIPGQEPRSIVENTLKLLHSNPTEANFKTSEAGFRVAIRSLTPSQLKDTEKLVFEAIQTQTEYRTQKLLDALLMDLKMEALRRRKT